ncbi:MAG TPA: NAD(P)H-hydrate epimerase, partial [Candidatus Fimenecus sp.]|nr:NAD(P)H-hydrate epimerase [Candidatus Fimenecus sp.]
MMKILPSNEIREIEAKANQSGISYLRLMENAGSACAKAIRKKFDKTTRRNVTVVCGKGKNGGDGYVIARKLAENEYNVNVVLTSREPPVGDAGEMLSRIRGTDIGIYLYDDDTELCEELIVGADITVDAVFGTGFKGAADEKNAHIFKAISKSLGYTVSIDIPSGIEADSGYVKGAAVKAQMTIAVMALKNSLVTFPAAEFAGNVIVVPIGIPEEIFSEYAGAYTLSPDEIRSKFPHRKENANKGDFGKGLIIAGSYDMPGAAVIAS